MWHSSKFLATLLVYEFYLRHCLEDRQRFDVVLTRLVNKGILVVQDGNVMTMVANENHFSFCCSLIWPVVESYWITCLYLFKLKQSSSPMAMGKFLMEIQWFAQSLIN